MTGRVPPLVLAPERSGSRNVAPRGPLVAASSAREVARAWEDFAAGNEVGTGVRPEILASWYRCRDRYGVDSTLDVAPGAGSDAESPRVDDGVVFTALGGLGAMAGREIERDGGVVTVADSRGRVLGAWGDSSARRRAELHNLAPWSSWSEACTGTNGMGTSLEVDGPVTVTGPEHWCQGFHDWACAGISVRDVVTGAPVASINISRWNASLPPLVLPWLTEAVACVEQVIRRRAAYEADVVVAAFGARAARTRGALVAMDRGGSVIAADDEAAAALGLTGAAPVVGTSATAARRVPDVPGLPEVVRWAIERSGCGPDWCGHARLAVCPGEAEVPLTLWPVVDGQGVVGLLCAVGVADGEVYSPGDAGDQASDVLPRRVIGVRDDRLVLLTPSEIRYAEADRNTVWLVTERGRIQSATRGLDNVEQALAPFGIRRVHRRYLVNLRRVAEIERGPRGELFLITDGRSHEGVPVSRRHAPDVRRRFGI